VITCPKCFKENQDHYKFCLGCGAELPRDASPKKFAPGTPPHGVAAKNAAAAAAAAPAPAAAPPAAPAPAPAPAAAPLPAAPRSLEQEVTSLGTGGPGLNLNALGIAPQAAEPVVTAPKADGAPGMVACPQCLQLNPPSNKFCATCGFKLSRPGSGAPAPIAAPAELPPVAVAETSQPVALLTALRADGSEAGSHALNSTVSTIGRDTGSIFAGDSYLSPRHATFTSRGSKLFVKDEGSLNGVYRKLRRDEPTLVRSGDVFRIGQEILRYETLQPLPPTPDGVERLGSPVKGYVGRIALIIGRETTGNAYPVPETGIHMGRERGDVLFPEDGYVSGLHCRLSIQNGQAFLTDLGSSNGSFVRLGAESEVHDGDILLMGQQLFRVNTLL
jgi:pSer/pThr/pTyr-binding forkhead associated (FHA) protein